MTLIALAAVLALLVQDTVVIRPAAPVWGSNVTTTREIRIGTVEGAPEYTFGWLSAVAVSADGHMFGLDAQAQTIRQYDPSGRHVRSYGGRGRGPGELQRAESILIAGNRLLVRDPRNSRIAIYPLDGGAPQSWRYETTSAGPSRMIVHPDGGISFPFSVPGANGYEDVVLRYRADGTIHDTIATPKITYQTPRLRVATNGGSASYSIPYTTEAVWTYTRDGRFVGGLPSRPAFVVVGGRAPVRVERTAAPVPCPVSAEL